jgi:hypothetical protein
MGHGNLAFGRDEAAGATYKTSLLSTKPPRFVPFLYTTDPLLQATNMTGPGFLSL